MFAKYTVYNGIFQGVFKYFWFQITSNEISVPTEVCKQATLQVSKVKQDTSIYYIGVYIIYKPALYGISIALFTYPAYFTYFVFS